jgi:hypothetical protein
MSRELLGHLHSSAADNRFLMIHRVLITSVILIVHFGTRDAAADVDFDLPPLTFPPYSLSGSGAV